MGKVAKSARQIMQTLWGTKGRPETEAYLDRCREQQFSRRRITSLVVREVVTPSPVASKPKLAESPRTADKWAAARARAKAQGVV